MAPTNLRGWIFDSHAARHGVRLWVLDERGLCHELLDPWRPVVRVAARGEAGRRAENLLRARLGRAPEKTARAELFSGELTEVWEARLPPREQTTLTGELKDLGCELYDADIHPLQAWHYERGHFPLAFGDFSVSEGVLRGSELHDDRWAVDYPLPHLKTMRLRLSGSEIAGKMDPNHAPRGSLLVETENGLSELEGPLDLQLETLARRLTEEDPDVLETEWGDSWLLPALTGAAERCKIPLPLSRDPAQRLKAQDSRTFYTYGRAVYQNGSIYLRGRWHLDVRNSFMLKECGRDGLFEVARLGALPVQRAARSTIGTALSSMQMLEAMRSGVLIPSAKAQTEDFRGADEFLVADKGGLAYEAEVGWHGEVVEYDFASMYPALMVQRNISPETVNCPCCPSERVPETGHHLCRRRPGLVPRVLAPLLKKRAAYKALAKSSHPDRASYKARASAHKWILVCCFDAQTRLLYREDGVIRIGRVGDLVEGHANGAWGFKEPKGRLELAGVDDAHHSAFRSVRRVLRVPAPPTLLELAAGGGRLLQVTPDHGCYRLVDGTLTRVRADELRPGDWLPLLAHLPSSDKTSDALELVELLSTRIPEAEKPLWRVRAAGLGKRIAAAWDTLRAAADGYSVGAPGVWERTETLPLHLLPLVGLAGCGPAELGRGKRFGGLVRLLPSRQVLDGDLGWFLGFYAGDGSSSGNMVRFGVGTSELECAERLQRILRERFQLDSSCTKDPRARMVVVQVNSVALQRVLEAALGIGPASDKGKLVVPEAVLNGPPSIRHGFLAGLLASDGSVSKTRNTVAWTSADADFIHDVALLLGLEGFRYRLAFGRRFHRVELRDADEVRRFATENALIEKHVIALTQQPGDASGRRGADIPVQESGLLALARRARCARKAPRIDLADAVPVETARIKLAQIEAASRRLGPEDAPRLQRLKSLLDSDMAFTHLRAITPCKPSGNAVYCFELDADPRLIAAQGGLLTSNCFGYLGYSNARFGKIEAHECVTAWGRETLLRAKDAAEGAGFKMLHALVDSVWLEGKPGTDYEALRRLIEEGSGVSLALEGVYKWLRFCPSKEDPRAGVPARYFGAFQDGEMKARGLAYRRRDTPLLIKNMQQDMLALLAKSADLSAAKALLPDLHRIAAGYRTRLRAGQASAEELAVTVHLSRDPTKYKVDTHSAIAAKALMRAGLTLHPGETLRYVISSAKDPVKDWRVTPLALMEGALEYDPVKYLELLDRAAKEIVDGLDAGPEQLRLF